MGPSPFLRGLLSRFYSKLKTLRFIPAPAGSAFRRGARPRLAAVHPRSGGVCHDQVFF